MTSIIEALLMGLPPPPSRTHQDGQFCEDGSHPFDIEKAQDSETFIVRAALPGIEEGSLKVFCTVERGHDILNIEAIRRAPERSPTENVFSTEIYYGKLKVSIQLPVGEGMLDKTAATFGPQPARRKSGCANVWRRAQETFVLHLGGRSAKRGVSDHVPPWFPVRIL